MKTLFTLMLCLLSISLTTWAKEINFATDYIVCTFNEEVTAHEISELQKTGITVIEIHEQKKIVYVQTAKKIVLSPLLFSKISTLTYVNKNGQEIPLRASASQAVTPSFLSMFFNFLYE